MAAKSICQRSWPPKQAQVVSPTVSGKSDDVSGSLCYIIHYYMKHVAKNTATNSSEISHSPSHSMPGMLMN